MRRPPLEYGFRERLAFSAGAAQGATVESVLLGNVPGAVKVVKSTMEEDRNGTDWWIQTQSGSRLSVDAKVRERDWAATHPDEDDLALETWSVVESGVVGWTRDERKRTDYILWLWVDTGRWCLIPFPFLCRVFADCWPAWSTTFRTARQRTPHLNGGGYHSECVFVPRRTVWAEIYKTFSGVLEAPDQCAGDDDDDIDIEKLLDEMAASTE